MESFEHSKCKPLTMPIAVEQDSRKVLSLRVGKIAAKGHFAAVAKKKYGPRICERRKCIDAVFSELQVCVSMGATIKSDESRHYPRPIKKFFPNAMHLVFKGRRGCVVGQGELKAGGWDPLFSLNHTYAMFRDNLKRLARRTWTTTKKPRRLELLMFLYAWFHNLRLDAPTSLVKLQWL